ncbi:MAG: nadB [Acidimicrobiaceae bacterium]|nr:nadB [Acidimicrobiaceae bacterium]
MTEATLRYLPSMSPAWRRETDVVIIGAGAAGLSAALDASRAGHRVILICKGGVGGGSTRHAQGGLAAVSEPDDSLDSHIDDTMVAGAGLADESAVRQLVADAPDVVRYLVDLGARFDGGSPGLEGGHSHRRIIHAGGDAIGAEIRRVLCKAVLLADIEILENTVALDLLRDEVGVAAGIAVGRLAEESDEMVMGEINARVVVLATGGFGQAYLSTTNPPELTGDGLALAARAGAVLSNMEFVQFHPTVLYVVGQRGQSPLLTEALRGAGAMIVDSDDVSVMRGRHERGDLAPRDVISFAMFERMHSISDPLEHLWLDARAIGASRLETSFPTVVELCRQSGFDPRRERVPVSPGAHYACGGIQSDIDGRTSIPGLYAIGEVASTGVHGANRLASNSLTEAIIAGRRLARHVVGALASAGRGSETARSVPTTSGRGVNPSSRALLAETMSTRVGVVRDREGLDEALEVVARTPECASSMLDLATIETTNLHTVTLLVAYAASLRHESRGCHRRRDFPAEAGRLGHSLSLVVSEGRVEARRDEMAVS